MASERRFHPSCRKEDVARAPYLEQQVECGTDELRRMRLAQRMVQIGERFDDPRLTPPGADIAKTGKGLVAHGRIGRQRRHHERKACLSIRVLRPRELCVENGVPVWY